MCTNAIYEVIEKDYERRMLHVIPNTSVVDRIEFIINLCKGKKVLDIGSGGQLSELLKGTTVNRTNADYCIDVEKDELPDGEYDFILCGEILEHLSNVGIFLDKLHKYNCDIIITVPNAFGVNPARKGIENVNLEHVAWYSYYTLKALIERHGYIIKSFKWYNGKPYTAEGIIFVIGV